jgi:hypothetical protein
MLQKWQPSMLIEQQIGERQARAGSAVARVLERPAGSAYGDYKIKSGNGRTVKLVLWPRVTVWLCEANLSNGLKSFGGISPATPASAGMTAMSFSQANLSAGELNRMGTLCNFFLASGSGSGVCSLPVCTAGGQ